MRRLKTVRRPPIYPKTPGHLPCSSLTHPLPLSSRRLSVSFGGFGFMGRYQAIPGGLDSCGIANALFAYALDEDSVKDAAIDAFILAVRKSGSFSPNPPMDGARTGEGGKGVTGAMIRARIRVDGRLAGGLQALLGAPMSACSGCGERDGRIGHGKRRSRTGMA